MVNPWHSAEVRVEALILAVSGGEVDGEVPSIANPIGDSKHWYYWLGKVGCGKLYTVILNVVWFALQV